MAAGVNPVKWGYARHIGRVGALAVALGVGVAVATGGTGIARAETDTASDSQGADAPSQTSSDQTTETDPADATPNEHTPPDAANDEDDEDDEAAEPAGGVDTSRNDAGQSTDTTPVDDASEDTDVPADEVLEPAPEDIPEVPAPQGSSGPTVVGDKPSASGDDDPIGPAHDREVPAPVNDFDDQATAADTDVQTVSRVLVVAPGSEQPQPVLGALAVEVSNPVQALMAAPSTIIGASTWVAAILSPLLAPGPVAPAQPPLVWALLGWIQREIQRTFFNRTPQAVTDVVTTSEDTETVIDVLGNDTDPDYSDVLGLGEVTQPDHGTVTINPDGTLTYTPDAGFHGTDTFTYTVNDDASPWHVHGLLGFLGIGHDSTGTVTVTVNPVEEVPVGVDDSYTTPEDIPLTVPMPGVLGNDTDGDGDDLSVVVDDGPDHGTLALNAGGSFTYTPNENFHGTDTFTYTVSDGDDTDTATVTVTVTSVNDAPIANDDTATTDEDTSGVSINVLANDNDIDGDSLTPTVTSGPANGTTNVTPTGLISYTPNANFHGTDTFTYTVSDLNGGTDTATVTVTVNSDNSAPLLAVGDPTTTNADTGARTYPVTVSDPDGDVVTLTADPQHGTFVDNGDGTFSYTPDRAFVRTLAPAGTATDTFTVTADDGNGGTATVDVTAAINFVNTRPTMAITVVEGTPENPVVTGHVELIDVNGDPVAYSLIRLQRNKGTLVFDQTTGNFTFTPSAEARVLAGQPGATFNDIQVILEIAVTDGLATRNTGVSLFIAPPLPTS